MKNTQNARPELNGLLWPNEISAVSVWIVECHPVVACNKGELSDSQWCDAGEELRLQPLFSSDRETRLQHQQKAAVK